MESVVSGSICAPVQVLPVHIRGTGSLSSDSVLSATKAHQAIISMQALSVCHQGNCETPAGHPYCTGAQALCICSSASMHNGRKPGPPWQTHTMRHTRHRRRRCQVAGVSSRDLDCGWRAIT
eukprot:365052-Chlamydomonas_euryale.AAC.29